MITIFFLCCVAFAFVCFVLCYLLSSSLLGCGRRCFVILVTVVGVAVVRICYCSFLLPRLVFFYANLRTFNPHTLAN